MWGFDKADSVGGCDENGFTGGVGMKGLLEFILEQWMGIKKVETGSADTSLENCAWEGKGRNRAAVREECGPKNTQFSG